MTDNLRTRRCENCAYWRAHAIEMLPSGDCRKRSPNAKDDAYAFWPKTDKTHWCGDWQVVDPHECIRHPGYLICVLCEMIVSNEVAVVGE